jgi:hypothetical protein
MAAAPVQPPAPAAVAPPAHTPRPAAPAVSARPSISAAKAPPAAQPRPGLAVPPRRPTPAPISVPAPVADLGSGRHHAAPTGRPGVAFDSPPIDQTPTPSVLAGMAIGSTPPPIESAYGASRNTGARPATPPAVPPAARHTGASMRVATPVPHSPPPVRRERVPSAELPISVDSGPHRVAPGSDPHVELPPQSVLDALPAPAPLPPLPHPGLPMELHGPTPASLAAPPQVPARLPTPAPAPLPAPVTLPPPAIFASVPTNEEVVSLRKGISKARLFLTLAVLGGAGGALWYFFLR